MQANRILMIGRLVLTSRTYANPVSRILRGRRCLYVTIGSLTLGVSIIDKEGA